VSHVPASQYQDGKLCVYVLSGAGIIDKADFEKRNKAEYEPHTTQ